MSNKRFFLIVFLMVPSMCLGTMGFAMGLIGDPHLFKWPFSYPYAGFLVMVAGAVGLAVFFTIIENDNKKVEDAYRMKLWRDQHWFDRRNGK